MRIAIALLIVSLIAAYGFGMMVGGPPTAKAYVGKVLSATKWFAKQGAILFLRLTLSLSRSGLRGLGVKVK